MSADVISDFLDAMRERGLEPADEIIADGTLHRVRWRQDKAGTRNGAYVLHLNGRPAGFAECFKRGIRFTWSAKGARLDPPERKRFAAQMAEERKRRQQEERERHELAAKRAQAIFAAARDADPEHDYLKRKGVEAHGLQVDGCNRLVVPLREPKGAIWSVQTIAPDGTKLFLTGGRKRGLFHLLGEPGDDLVIAEGFATAASIREATGLPVAIAFDAGNLGSVAKSIHCWLPLARIVIAVDDDHATEGNPGMSKARAAAELIGGNVAVPTFLEDEQGGTDFNDLAALRGHEPVAAIIRAAFKEEADKEPGPAPDPAPQLAAATTAQPDDDWEMPLLTAVEELNAKHFVVTVGGQTVIATVTRDDALGRELLVFSQERDIKLRYRHRHYLVGFTAKGLRDLERLGRSMARASQPAQLRAHRAGPEGHGAARYLQPMARLRRRA
jgi:putative DNA primase/helicase